MTPASSQALAFATEGDAGNTDKNVREIFAVERLRRRGRLEDSVSTARELGAIANAMRDDRARRNINPRIEDSTSRGNCVRQDKIGRNFVADCGIEDDRRRVAIGFAREQLALDAFRPLGRALAVERVAARDHDRAKIFLFVRHSRCHGGSGFNCSNGPRGLRARPSLSLSFSIRLTAGLYPRYALSRKPSMRLKKVARASSL